MGQQVPYPYAVTETPPDLTDQDLAFLSRYTGEKDLDKLREHVISVWRSVKAKAWVYCCIQKMAFIQPRITTHDFYPHIGDLGTCFGQDARQMLLDGLPEDSITVTDITPDYWEFGKQLFMDGGRLGQGAKKLEHLQWGEPGEAGVEAIFGSFTDPSFVSAEPPVGPLGRLAGRVTVAWAGAVLHVLSREDVRAFAAHAHAMLAPGGVWIGTTGGREEPGEWARTPDGSAPRYLHSSQSLSELLREVGFAEVEVKPMGRPQQPDAGPGSEPAPLNIMLQYTARKKQ